MYLDKRLFFVQNRGTNLGLELLCRSLLTDSQAIVRTLVINYHGNTLLIIINSSLEYARIGLCYDLQLFIKIAVRRCPADVRLSSNNSYICKLDNLMPIII